MDEFKNEKLLRLKDIIPDVIPVSKSAWWLGVKKGIYPEPVKLGQRITAWRHTDIMQLTQNGVQINQKNKKEVNRE